MTPKADEMKPDAGFTLFELVAAMAIFALVAIMGLQILTMTLRQRDQLAALDRRAAEVGVALTLLRSDMSAMVPLLFRPPNSPTESALSMSVDGERLSLSVSGQSDLPPVSALGLHRSEWRLDRQRQRLYRRVWPVLSPANSDALHPETLLLSDVSDVSVRTHWPQLGWVSGVTSGQPRAAHDTGEDRDGALLNVANRYSDVLPNAIEITVHLQDIGPIVLIESLL
jgi:general secretion pathway protein J